MGGYKWTDEEIEILRKYYPISGSKRVHNLLPHRTRGAIAAKANSLGIKIGVGHGETVGNWTNKEVDLLKEIYLKSPEEELVKLFPERSYIAIRAKAKRIGLHKRTSPCLKWTKEEDKIIEALYRNSKKEELLKKLPNRTWGAIRQRGRILGIKRDKILFRSKGVKKWWHTKQKHRLVKEKECPTCHKIFKPRHNKKVHCSSECYLKALRAGVYPHFENVDYKKLARASSIRMRKNNPMRDPKVRKKVSKTLKRLGHNPIANIRKKYGKIDKISPPQQELYEIVKKYYPKAKLEHVVGLEGRHWAILDIALKHHKVDIEYDGKLYHLNKEKDQERDAKLRTLGWKVIRINKDNWNNFVEYLENGHDIQDWL